jgi:proline iminopeptidase
MAILNSSEEKYRVKSGNATLSVSCFNSSREETIILLHGGPGVPDEMTELRDWLINRYRVINFDQRGIGDDCKGCSFTMEDYIGDINNISAFFKAEKFHLFGHSWGGLYAQLYAAIYPQKILSLFLCSPASGTGEIWTQTEKEIFRYNYQRSTLMEWLGMAWNTFLGTIGNNQAYSRLFKQVIINYHKGYGVEPPDANKLARISSRAGTMTRREIKKYPVLPPFGHTPYPVIITYGDNDAYGQSKQYVYDRFPYAQTAIIPNCGHTPWKHNLKAFVQVLESFY